MQGTEEPQGAIAVEPVVEASPEAAPITFRERIITACAAVLLLVLLAVVFRALGGVLKPFFIALFLTYLVFPLVELLHRRGVPKPMGYGLSLIGLIVTVYGVFQLLIANVRSFFQQAGKYQARLAHWEMELTDLAIRARLLPEGERLQLGDVISMVPQDAIARAVGGGTTVLLGLTGNLLVVLIVMIFIMLEVERIPERIELAYGEARGQHVLQIFEDINSNVQRYILIKVVFSLLTAGFSVLVMALFGLDFFLLFGAMVFVFNFIPYVGSWVATILPCVVALLQFTSPWTALWLFGLLAIVQTLFGSILEPRFHGRNLNLSPLLILIALAVWGWLWGVVGMILAIPIMVSARITLEQLDATRPLSVLMSNVSRRDLAEQAHLRKLNERAQDMARQIEGDVSTSQILSGLSASSSGVVPHPLRQGSATGSERAVSAPPSTPEPG